MKILAFLKRYYFRLIAIIIFVYLLVLIKTSEVAIANIIKENQITLLFLLILTIGCWFLFYLNKNPLVFDTGALFTLLGIMCALVIFLVQNFEENFSKIQTLQIVTVVNCELAKQIEINPKGFFPSFSTEIFEQNPGFILNKFGISTLQFALSSKAEMDEANKLLLSIDNARSLNMKPPVEILNNLSRVSQNLHKDMCDGLAPLFLKKTEDIQKTTLPSALYSLFFSAISFQK